MAVWAYECTLCDDPDTTCFVACDTVSGLGADTTIVEVRIKRRWHRARLDRSRRHQVDGMLLREVVPADPGTGQPGNPPDC